MELTDRHTVAISLPAAAALSDAMTHMLSIVFTTLSRYSGNAAVRATKFMIVVYTALRAAVVDMDLAKLCMVPPICLSRRVSQWSMVSSYMGLMSSSLQLQQV